MAENISLNERADALERKMSDELDVLVSKSALFNMADGKLGGQEAMRCRYAKTGIHAETRFTGACVARRRHYPALVP
jgi:hypothetical protein